WCAALCICDACLYSAPHLLSSDRFVAAKQDVWLATAYLVDAMQLTPVALSAENFAVYGDVVEHQGSQSRRVLRTPFSGAPPDLRHRFTVNRLIHVDAPTIQFKELERHPFSAQTFIPLSGSRHLVVVALSDAHGKL